MRNFVQKYVCCCCPQNNELEVEINDERTPLINSTVINGLPKEKLKNPPVSELDNILHKTASNIIDVAATEGYIFDQNEFLDKSHFYKNLLTKIPPNVLQKLSEDLYGGEKSNVASSDSLENISAVKKNALSKLGGLSKRFSTSKNILPTSKNSKNIGLNTDMEEQNEVINLFPDLTPETIVAQFKALNEQQSPSSSFVASQEKTEKMMNDWFDEIIHSLEHIKILHKEDFVITL